MTMYALFEDNDLASDIHFSDDPLKQAHAAVALDPAASGHVYEIKTVCPMHKIHSVDACGGSGDVEFATDTAIMTRVLDGLRRIS